MNQLPELHYPSPHRPSCKLIVRTDPEDNDLWIEIEDPETSPDVAPGIWLSPRLVLLLMHQLMDYLAGRPLGEE